MSFKAASMFEIVRLVGLQPQSETGYCVLIDGSSVLTEDLREELEAQNLGALSMLDVASQTTAELVDGLRAQTAEVVLLHGFRKWNPENFTALDINRSMLDTGRFLIFSVDLQTAGRFLGNAPNIRSFLGANIFAATPDRSVMTATEIESRLTQLREFYQLTDAEVIVRAEKQELSPDPHFAEWLVLLGRSELVR